VLSAIWNSFYGAQFSTTLTAESGEVFYKKVIVNLISFPMVYATISSDSQNSSYNCISALSFFCSRESAGYLFLHMLMNLFDARRTQ
jgi:hypothetical protein